MAFADRSIGIAGQLNTSVSITRGLPQLVRQTSVVAHKLKAELVAWLAYQRVRGGEETVIELRAARIPRHAEILGLTAKLELNAGSAASGPKLTQRAEITEVGKNETKTYQSTLDPPAGPSSLILGMEGGDVIWTWSGRPGSDSFDVPDFSEQANGFLERLAAGEAQGDAGLVTLRLTLRSDVDTWARLSVPEGGLRYRLVQPQGWDNELDGTVHMDRNLELGFGRIVELTLDPIVDGPSEEMVQVEELRLEVGGDFGPERLLGDVVPATTREFATVGDGFAVAQELSLPASLPSAECVGVALALATEAEAELYFEIQPDAAGSPASGNPLAGGTLRVSPADRTGLARWVTGRFAEPTTLLAGSGPYWVVLKQIRGVARLALLREGGGALGRLLTNRGGQFWQSLHARGRQADSGRALARLLYVPEPDTRTAAVELIAESLGGDGATGHPATAKVEPGPEPRPIVLRFPGEARARGVRLVVRSHGEGRLSLANLVQVYLPS